MGKHVEHEKYTKERLEAIVRVSRTWSDVIRALGRETNGGTRGHIQRRVRSFGIPTEHFVCLGWAKGTVSSKKKKPSDLLMSGAPNSALPRTHQLRRALLEAGVPHQCSVCGLSASWQSKPLVLQIDHLNQNRRDNRPENLRFLCPNCHSQTDTWGRRKI